MAAYVRYKLVFAQKNLEDSSIVLDTLKAICKYEKDIASLLEQSKLDPVDTYTIEVKKEASLGFMTRTLGALRELTDSDPVLVERHVVLAGGTNNDASDIKETKIQEPDRDKDMETDLLDILHVAMAFRNIISEFKEGREAYSTREIIGMFERHLRKTVKGTGEIARQIREILGDD